LLLNELGYTFDYTLKQETMTTIVFKSDFKDFSGLQKACKFFHSRVTSRCANYIQFDGVNPYEKAYAWDVNYNSYAKAIEFAMQNGFSLFRVRGMMDSLKMDGEEVLNLMLAKVAYPEGHIKRLF